MSYSYLAIFIYLVCAVLFPIGLLTTHDLALAKIADQLAPLGANAHFQDQVVDGRMRFDYRLRPGAVEHSNTLELMRSVGLEV
jgi:DNA mismatch repair ATPase MutS